MSEKDATLETAGAVDGASATGARPRPDAPKVQRTHSVGDIWPSPPRGGQPMSTPPLTSVLQCLPLTDGRRRMACRADVGAARAHGREGRAHRGRPAGCRVGFSGSGPGWGNGDVHR